MAPFFLYLAVFLGAFLVDVLAFLGPPAWTVMLFFMLKYDLNLWLTLSLGVAGSVLGRYSMSMYFGRLSRMVISEKKNADLVFLGEKLSQSRVRSWFFVFIYTLLPIPTTPLFNVMGIARIMPGMILPPFFVGKFISDGYMLLAADMVAEDLPSLLNGAFNFKTIATMVFALGILAATLFIDWMTLLQEHKLRLKFNIWK